MVNKLIEEAKKNKDIYFEFKHFCIKVLKTEDKFKKLELAKDGVVVPYLISFIESKGVDFKEAISYFGFHNPQMQFWKLLKNSIIGCFRKLEKSNFDYAPF